MYRGIITVNAFAEKDKGPVKPRSQTIIGQPLQLLKQ